MNNKILKTSTVGITKDQVWCELAGEAVILHLQPGVYYTLSPVGARIWSLIQKPETVEAILETILAEYDVEPTRCESDLFAFLQDLAVRELIEIDAEANEAVA